MTGVQTCALPILGPAGGVATRSLTAGSARSTSSIRAAEAATTLRSRATSATASTGVNEVKAITTATGDQPTSSRPAGYQPGRGCQDAQKSSDVKMELAFMVSMAIGFVL